MDQKSVELFRRRPEDAPPSRPSADEDDVAPPASAPNKQAPAARSHLTGALELVERAAATIDHLQLRSDKFETLAQSLLDRTKQQVSRLETELTEWRRKAEQSSARAEDAERRLEEMELRAKEAETLAEKCNVQMSELCNGILQRLGPRCEVEDKPD